MLKKEHDAWVAPKRDTSATPPRVGELGVAVYDCILAGVCPSVLVGRVEFGSPSSYRVRKVRREVGEVLNEKNQFNQHPRQ